MSQMVKLKLSKFVHEANLYQIMLKNCLYSKKVICVSKMFSFDFGISVISQMYVFWL